jgi:hypothetical protein
MAPCALIAAFCSAVLKPFPLNCSSERMMFAPNAPLGKAASWSCVNLATIASIFAAEICPLLRCLRCFAASSGANGAKATNRASIAAICLTKFSFIFLFWKQLTASHEGAVISLLRSLSVNRAARFLKRFSCCSICYKSRACYEACGRVRSRVTKRRDFKQTPSTPACFRHQAARPRLKRAAPWLLRVP